MKIVAIDAYTVNPDHLPWEGWDQLGEFQSYDRTAPEDVVPRLKDADMVLTNKVCFPRQVLAALPRLRYIGVLATGYNVVDLAAAREQGIIVTNIPAYSTASVAQLTFAHLLHICHHVASYNESVQQGAWQHSDNFCFYLQPQIELWGKTFGIVGVGHIGEAVARIAQSMGMNVMAFSSRSAESLAALGITKARSLQHLFREADVISLHCPLTDKSHHIINAESLSWMKPSAILLNTGRGALIDEKALADALSQGRIYAAGVDVLTEEPPVSGSPLIGVPRCFLTPHIAWASEAARQRLLQIALDNARAFLLGEPCNVVS